VWSTQLDTSTGSWVIVSENSASAVASKLYGATIQTAVCHTWGVARSMHVATQAFQANNTRLYLAD